MKKRHKTTAKDFYRTVAKRKPHKPAPLPPPVPVPLPYKPAPYKPEPVVDPSSWWLIGALAAGAAAILLLYLASHVAVN